MMSGVMAGERPNVHSHRRAPVLVSR